MRLPLALALVVATACTGSDEGRATVTVFAAASLKSAVDDIDARLLTPAGHATRLTYAGTPALARQIEAGAPADLLIAADEQWMDHLQAGGHIDAASRLTLVGNALVLVAPAAADTAAVSLSAPDLRKLLQSARLAIADPATVPAGRYARQALEHLRLWEAVRDRLAPHENVRAALALVARGEAPAGIVYASDAADEPRVRVVARIPDDSHTPIRYSAAAVTGAASGALDVLRLLASPEARAIFLRHGFSAPPAAAP